MNLDGIRKVFLLGDLHLGVRNNSVEWLEIQKDFLLNFFMRKVDEDFDQTSDILVLEGDVFHSREAVNIRIQNEALEIFTKLAEKFKRGVFIILGNHDTYYKDKNEVHSLKPLSNLADNIHVYENPGIVTINGKHGFLMLPWMEDPDKLSKVVTDHSDFCQYIVCHTDIRTFKFNKWRNVEVGLDPIDLKDFKKVYCGHIHIRQEKENILYTGSPYQMDRGDIGNGRGFYKLDVTGEEVIETFVRNNHSPHFVKYDMKDLLEMSVSSIYAAFNNNFVDVMMEAGMANRISIPRFLEEIPDSKHRKLEFFTYSQETKERERTKSEFNPEGSFNITEIFKNYLKSKDYPKETKVKLAKKFVELHTAVKMEKNYD